MEHILTENYLRSTISMSDNLDIKLLMPFVNEVEQIHLRDTIGDRAFDELKYRFNAKSLDDNEKHLVSVYIKPYMAWKVLYEALPWITTQLRNKGVVQQDSENNVKVDDMAKINMLLRKADEKSAAFEKRLKDYLCNFAGEYTNGTNIFFYYTHYSSKLIMPNYDDPGKSYGPVDGYTEPGYQTEYWRRYWGLR